MRKFVSSVVALTVFGCGAASEPSYSGYSGGSTRHNGISEPRVSTSASLEAPQEIVTASQTCVDRHAPGLSQDHYAVLFDLESTKEGKVIKVNVKDSMLGGSELEACLTRALERMAVPATVLNSQHGVTPQSRSMTGVVQAAAAPIAMLPIVLVAAGVTILTVVTIRVVAHAVDDVEAEKERCKQVKASCIERCADNTLDKGFHEPLFTKCVRVCMEHYNCL